MSKQLTLRRQNADEQIAYYAHQAKLARLGHSTRRSAEFFERQILFFKLFDR